LNPDPHIVDILVLSVFLMTAVSSIFLNMRDFRKSK